MDEVLDVVDPSGCQSPAAPRERGASHDARRPDVAVDPALVADAVGQPGFFQQLVELGSVPVGHLPAYVGDLVLDVTTAGAGTRHRGVDRTQERVGHLDGGSAADVEPVEQPVPGEREVVVEGAAGVGVE